MQRSTARTVVASLALALAWVFLSGFAPFKSEGITIFRVASGGGVILADPDDQGLEYREIETKALFHSLSSRFGGGGTLVYMEHAPVDGLSGLLLLDVRHGGLPDLQSTLIDLPNRQRVEAHYQEWNASKDVFQSARVQGELQILDIYRGENFSAMAIEFDLFFFMPGEDGVVGTDDDLWRRVQGRATTNPTVEEAIDIESDVIFDRRTNGGGVFAPEGDVYVNCFGETTIVEEEYDDDSYYYEDRDGGGCEGDTWDDDSTDPADSGGCAGEEVIDEEDPSPDSSCEGSGDEYDDGDYEEEDESFYDDDEYDDDYDDTSSCEGDSEPDSDPDTSTDSSDDDDSSSCEGDSEAEAAVGPRRASALRHYLLTFDGPATPKARPRFSKETRRTLRRVMGYLPFFLLGGIIHVWRRREQRPPRS